MVVIELHLGYYKVRNPDKLGLRGLSPSSSRSLDTLLIGLTSSFPGFNAQVNFQLYSWESLRKQNIVILFLENG